MIRKAAIFAGLAFRCHGSAGRAAGLTVPIAYFVVIGTAGGRRDGSHPLRAFPVAGTDTRTIIAGLALPTFGFVTFSSRKHQPARQGHTGR